MVSTREVSTRECAVIAAGYLDDPELFQSSPEAETIAVLRLQPGMIVAELGAGCHLTLALSEAVGDAGHLFAIEAAPVQVARFNEQTQGLRNVHLVEAPYHETPLAADSCDRVLMSYVWPRLSDPRATLREAARLLREPGRLVLIEWQAAAVCPPGPQSSERVGFGEMVQLLSKNGWDIHGHGDIGPYSYYLEAAISDESVQS